MPILSNENNGLGHSPVLERPAHWNQRLSLAEPVQYGRGADCLRHGKRSRPYGSSWLPGLPGKIMYLHRDAAGLCMVVLEERVPGNRVAVQEFAEVFSRKGFEHLSFPL